LTLSLYTISAENPFLRVLARAVLSGFPVGDNTLSLSHWTMLVPNRRSARALEQIFLEESGKPALILPRIKPIGDIDEDLIADSLPAEGLPDAIAKTDHLHAILTQLESWAKTATSELAEDVRASGTQAFALAQSLQRLVGQFETEDAEASKIKSVYDLDLAGHRYNILDLLSVVTEKLPQHLQDANLLGPAARRNAMIRLEARRIAAGAHKGPIIAAGSTGTNPATRELLKAIAAHPRGAVILPGLDLELDETGWTAVTAEHPQFGLHSLLQDFKATRADVQMLGNAPTARSWLISQALRPSVSHLGGAQCLADQP
jgi:ATP-dependent helicase/nuclease subunit B